jgi:hypothetical protein
MRRRLGLLKLRVRLGRHHQLDHRHHLENVPGHALQHRRLYGRRCRHRVTQRDPDHSRMR